MFKEDAAVSTTTSMDETSEALVQSSYRLCWSISGKDVFLRHRCLLEMARGSCNRHLYVSNHHRLLRKSFSYLGLAEVIVSDNATTFTSAEFAEFLKVNGIHHICSPPYHPALNGLAEPDSLRMDKSGTVSSQLSRFLLWYRITPHSTTGSSPSELMWGQSQRLRSRLYLVLPDAKQRPQEAQDSQKGAHDSHSTDRQIQVNDTVYVRNSGVGPQWLSGCVVGLQGLAMYRV